ncbi:MAG: helicase, partial [Myxococcaceae bacterium]|nr:helicase [Myxococcaceae bacterium]
ALAVRDAWARAHRAQLLPRLVEALDIVTEERFVARARGLAEALAGVSAVFPVAGCTLLSLRGSFALDPGVIDRLVVDEAGQCAPVYTVAALARARRALVTGDVAQLPPVYTLDDRVDARLARGLDDEATAPFRMGASATTSAQAVAEQRAAEPRSLVEHFRSQPAIVALASSWSGYALDVRTPPRSLAGVSRRLSRPVIVVDVRGDGGRAPEGVVNEAEAARVVAAVAALVADGVDPRDVAVLTPFVGQSARIERMLLAQGLVHERGVLVRTVHKLQGGERRVVVFSVTATAPKHLRWLAARPHLLHVATSRAQDHLVVFLDVERARSEPLLGPLIALAR